VDAVGSGYSSCFMLLYRGTLSVASDRTKLLRTPIPPARIYVCAYCARKSLIQHPLVSPGVAVAGGTLHRSRVDGIYYHWEHLPENVVLKKFPQGVK
jgi:hypothetical protein